MRIGLIIFFCVIGFSASAQFWQKISFKKQHIISAELPLTKDNSISRIQAAPLILNDLKAQPVTLALTDYSLEATSMYIMGLAKHNMRFRVYHEASYNFSDLAQLYIKLHRMSEAKWYMLQSNRISREENDDKHTISNLISLAEIKAYVGDIPSARTDLEEARDLALMRGMDDERKEIEKKLLLLAQNIPSLKPDVRYAESAGTAKKAL